MLFSIYMFLIQNCSLRLDLFDLISSQVDDLQPDAISAFNARPQPSSELSVYKYLKTPHLDSLAESGALFSRAYTPHPICSPARYAILTGRYASRSRRNVEFNFENEGKRDRESNYPTVNGKHAWVVNGTVTLAHAMRNAGFRTAMTGKV